MVVHSVVPQGCNSHQECDNEKYQQEIIDIAQNTNKMFRYQIKRQ